MNPTSEDPCRVSQEEGEAALSKKFAAAPADTSAVPDYFPALRI